MRPPQSPLSFSYRSPKIYLKIILVSRAAVLTAALLVLAFLITLPASPAYAASYVVNTLNDDTNNDGLCTLREAILVANNIPANADCGAGSNADDTITFSVSGTITLGLQLPNIADATTAGMLTIDGGGNITLNGNNTVRVLYVDGSGELTLENLSVINGHTGHGGSGGGLHNDGGVVTIINSTFSSNSATFGAGLYNSSFGRLTIINSTFSDNRGGNGGGLLNDGGTANIANSTFTDNSGGNGGGFLNDWGALSIANSTFSGNGAETGGAFYNTGGTIIIINSTFSVNPARFFAIYSPSAKVTFKNTIIAYDSCLVGIRPDSTNNIATDPSCSPSFTRVTLVQLNLGSFTGSSAYFPLNPGSAAIDAGNNPICAAPPVNNTSQNGIMRPQDGDGNGTFICDIGAYEAPTPPDACTTKPDKPLLKQPADGATLHTSQPILHWKATHCAGKYIVVVKDAASGGIVDRKKNLTELHYQTKPLATDKTYKWFVKARNDFGARTSVAWTFTLQ